MNNPSGSSEKCFYCGIEEGKKFSNDIHRFSEEAIIEECCLCEKDFCQKHRECCEYVEEYKQICIECKKWLECEIDNRKRKANAMKIGII
jgi:hypothetical protein